jgi:hypothetical protein
VVDIFLPALLILPLWSFNSFYCATEGKMGEENEDEGTKYYIQHRCKFFLMML